MTLSLTSSKRISSKTKKDFRSLSKALNEVINELYYGKVWNLDIFIVGSWKKQSERIIGNMIRKKSEGFKCQLHFMKDDLQLMAKRPNLTNSAIFFIESNRYLNGLNNNITMKNVDYLKFQHLFIILNSEPIQKWNLYTQLNLLINHESFLIKDDDDHFKLVSFQWFIKSCTAAAIELNKFSMKTQKWSTKEFGIKEIKHFHGCKVEVPSSSPQALTLMKILNPKLNATIEILKGVSTLFNVMIVPKNLANGTFWFFYKFLEEEITHVIPLGEEYTSYEKFYLPFDLDTWICCGVFFGGAFLVIFIVNQTRNPRVQHIVYGSRVQSPALNVLAAFFGQSQNVLPSRSFGRFILMIFILFCLIIRTGYQGVQFDLMYKVGKKQHFSLHNLLMILKSTGYTQKIN